jgi:DNA-binding transcriptional ArsR family regulator
LGGRGADLAAPRRIEAVPAAENRSIEVLDMQAFTCILLRQVITCIYYMAERYDTDALFKALADPSRRKLLDLLHAHDGRTLNELCEHLDMTRQGVTQHLGLLEAANLVTTVRRGREKLHFLNPVPLQEIYERWIAKFEKPRLKALSDLKQRLEKDNG